MQVRRAVKMLAGTIEPEITQTPVRDEERKAGFYFFLNQTTQSSVLQQGD